MSPNAGAVRLLVPAGKSADIAEMRTGREVILTIGVVRQIIQPGMQMGREMTEVLFDDGSPNPFALFVSMPQWERVLALPGREPIGIEFTVWENRRGQAHQVLSRPGFLRRADLPCLKPLPKS